MADLPDPHDHRSIYDQSAEAWDLARRQGFSEQGWVDLAVAGLAPGSAVLDLGCGTGAPIAAHLIGAGFTVTGLDFSRAMLAIARARLPQGRWVQADMRKFDLGQVFSAIIAWDSFFHLETGEQRAMFARFAAHLAPGGRLLFTSGPRRGEVMGQVPGGPVYHASLSVADYAHCLEDAGLRVLRFVAEDAQVGGHTIWLAEREEVA